VEILTGYEARPLRNVARCGSRSTVRQEYGASSGATSTVPPRSAAFAAIASALSVENATPHLR